MNKLRLLIVDDEPLIRAGLRLGLAPLDDVEIIGEAESGVEAVQKIAALRPELVLLDVQMPDFTGLDVVRQIGPENMPAVVFVTAYDEYALKAFELNAVDYLLKPFDEDRLQESIRRARDRINAQQHSALAEQLQALLHAPSTNWPERIVVKNGERFELIPVDSIDWVESANNYVQLHCGSKQHLLGETLTSLENRLDPKTFLRIHRCRMVNALRIIAIHPLLSGTYEMELRNGVRLTTGRQYKDAVQQLIGR